MSAKFRTIALLLAAFMLLPLLIACGNTEEDKKAMTGGTYEDDMGDKTEFEGKTFTILAREDNIYGNFAHEIVADEGETELVNQAVYQRNCAVEDRFGITINADLRPGHWVQKDDFINRFQTSISAGEGAYDMIMSQQGFMNNINLFQYYLNVFDLPYINFNKDYYYTDILEETSIDNKQFFILGDYSLTFWEYLYLMYFNKKLAADYNLPDIYEFVRSGEWTIDKCIELSRGIYKDLNGDNWPGEEDQYGYITLYTNTLDTLPAQFGIFSTARNEQGDVIIDVDQGKVVSVLTKMIEFFDTEDVYHDVSAGDNGKDDNKMNKIFREGRALFYPERIERAQDFRDVETDFGMVPYPKWDTNQPYYYTESQDGYSIAVVPIDVKDQAFCGAMIEALTSESSRTVIPTYNDQALTYKYVRDEDSAEMLKLIREHIVISFGSFYLGEANASYWVRRLILDKNTNFVSYYASNKASYERRLRQTIKAFNEHQ